MLPTGISLASRLSATATGAATLITTEGTVTGTTASGVARFGNIPYAQPPERWKPPELPEPYPGGRLDGTEFGPACVQPDYGSAGSEDCLQLNVFAPTSAIARPDAALPVLLWIHGGAYQSGSASGFDVTPLVSFLDGKAVAVTINYRLGVFGFLGSSQLRPDASASTGNYGLLDQRAAFAWVQRNAPSFGGDPSSVMIFGESAGAGSVSCHLALAGSSPFFQRAALESGSFAPWVARPLEHAEGIFSQVMPTVPEGPLLLGYGPWSIFSQLSQLSPLLSRYSSTSTTFALTAFVTSARCWTRRAAPTWRASARARPPT